MIGLSPLSTVHPNTLQRILVRSSTRCYPCFNLTMDRSLGFVSNPCDSKSRYSHSLSLRLQNVCPLTSPHRLTRWLIMQKARRQPLAQSAHRPPTACKLLVSGSISLPSQGFFSPFPHGTGSLSVINEYLALESGLPRFRPGFTCPALLRCQSCRIMLSSTGLSPFVVQLSRSVRLAFSDLLTGPTTPKTKFLVWALPISLAATQGISLISFPPPT